MSFGFIADGMISSATVEILHKHAEIAIGILLSYGMATRMKRRAYYFRKLFITLFANTKSSSSCTPELVISFLLPSQSL